MKKLLILLVIALNTLRIEAQEPNLITKPLVIGHVKTISSKVLNEDRVLNIYLPHDYDSSKSYPVIYLLDGSMNEDFLHIVGIVQFFNLQFKMPEFLVVGIANVDRKRDFTFHTDLKDLQKKYPTTGHSDAFIKFIEEELQPFVATQYKTTATKYLIGQSLGGLLATEVLLKKPQLFTHYLIVSPSLWWDNESLLKQAKSLIDKQKDIDVYAYISVGKGEDKIMQREANEIKDILQNADKKKIKTDFKLMVDDNHATILHRSIYEAFLKLFPFKEND